ncbi:MAG TPA: phytanoyl-CoA dioxygenase family protein [Terriglobia bacterium]|nr:phytanoyl-CoA dioxygenase family protein [Terriglobia bacterium]
MQNGGLSAAQIQAYQERGYYFPLQVLTSDETQEYLGDYHVHVERHSQRLKALTPREQYLVLSETHTYLNWVYRIVSHPKVLDYVESILGPNLLVWGTRWFSKMPGDKAFVSWHQDGTYWGLRPPRVTTAWVALSESKPENGGLRVVPGSHRGDYLPQRDTYDPANALSRGQEIAVEVDEAQAVDLALEPGQMSLHHIGIVHGSKANTSQKPRIGLAIRYITPEVVQDGSERSLAMLVRGRDGFGHFELIDPPRENHELNQGEVPEAILRMMKNIMPQK